MKRIYYARPMSIYHTPIERDDIALLRRLGFSVVNPASPEYAHFTTMAEFLGLVEECDALAFRSFACGAIPAGVHHEMCRAEEIHIPVIEIPGRMREVHTIGETRTYLYELGQRTRPTRKQAEEE
jgi:hypothetical protein